MKITALTAHCDRPEAWKLCEKYMARQTRASDQWLVIDSSPEPITPSIACDYHHRPDLEKMSDKVLWAIKENLIQGDAVVFWENDDWYHPEWIEWCERYLPQYDIVGQGLALYYHAGQRWWSDCKNARHASLCQTAIRRELLPFLTNLIKGFDNQFFDTRLWRLDKRRYLDMPDHAHRLVVGMKGLPGKLGYSQEHRPEIPTNVKIDPSLFVLWKLIGQDAEAYLPFFSK
jgi:hypothetical protein